MNLKRLMLAGVITGTVFANAGELEDLRAELSATKAKLAKMEIKSQEFATKKEETSILENGEFSVTVGAFIDKKNYKDRNADLSDTPDEGFGTGYVDISFEKKLTDDLTLGAGFLGVERLYEDSDFDSNDGAGREDGSFWNDQYETRSIMYNLYLKYDFNESFITLGRQNIDDIFGQDPSLAAVVGINEIENVSILAGVIHEQATADSDEIVDWARVNKNDDDGIKPGNIFFANVAIDIPEIATITPYIYSQDEVADVYGANIAIEKELSDDLSIGLALDYNVIQDDTLGGETGYNYGVSPSVTLGQFSFGLGYIKTSNDAVGDRTVFGADYFDTMPEAEKAFENDAESFSASIEVAATEQLTIGLSFGETNYADGSTTYNTVEESKLEMTYAVNDNLELSAEVLNVDFKDNDEVDYYKFVTGVTYSF